jgi:carbon storage regulator CsrA
MLVLSRRIGEKVFVGNAEVVVLGVIRGKVRLGFVAPPEIPIHRDNAGGGAAGETTRETDGDAHR